LLIVQEYSHLDVSKIKDLVILTLNKLDPRSMVRAFVIRIAFYLHFDVSDENIKKYMLSNKMPYLYDDKVITL